MVSRLAARLLPFALLLGACAEESAPLPPLPVYPPIEPMVLKVEGATACDIDADCDDDTFCFLSRCSVQCESGVECESGVCDDRGRCTESTNKSANGDLPAGPPNNRLMGLEIEKRPELEIQVQPGEEFVTVTFETSSSVNPLGGLSYRIESSADDSLARRVQTSNGGTTHTVVIPTGFSNPEFEGDEVSINIVTPIGTIPLILKELTDIFNHYEGTLKLSGLGTEIPIKFGALKRPDGTEWFIVPSGYADIFGPKAADAPSSSAITAGEGRQARVRMPPVTTQGTGSTSLYEGKFNTLYNIPLATAGPTETAPGFARSPVFAGLTPNSIKREIKYNFKRKTDGTLSGNFSDIWTSFYATNSAPEKIEITGRFTMKVASDSEQWKSDCEINWDIPVKIVEVVNNASVDGSPNGYVASANAFEISGECITAAKGWEDDKSNACDGSLEVYNTGSRSENYAKANNCAAVLRTLPEGKTITQKVVEQLNGSATDTSTQSFEDFLKDCADPTKSVCTTSLGRACGLEFEAKAFQSASTEDEAASWERYVALLLDVTGGLQLAAFYTDTTLRRQWLNSASFASTAATGNAAATLNKELMDKYERQVFTPNLKALRYYMAPSVLAYLSSSPKGDAAKTERDRLLISMVAAWTAAADSLALSAQRWNEIYRLDVERNVAANKVAANLGELYRSAIVIMQLQRNAGRAAEGAPIATGLNTLLLRYEILTNSFNELLFARDGEVAVSTSLDPNNPGLLTQRREKALEAVDDASVKIDGLLEKLLENDIRNLEIYNGLDTSIDASQKRLLELCGKPVGTTRTDERPSTAAGVCGFWQDAAMARSAREAGKISVSQSNGSSITLTLGSRTTNDVLTIEIGSTAATNVVGSAAALAVYDIGIAQRNLDVATVAKTAATNNLTRITQQVRDFSAITPTDTSSNGSGTDKRTSFETRYTTRQKQITDSYNAFVAQIEKMKGYEQTNYDNLVKAQQTEEAALAIRITQELLASTAAVTNAVTTALDAGTQVTSNAVEYAFVGASKVVEGVGEKSAECVKVHAGTSVYVGGPACAVNLSAGTVAHTLSKTGDAAKISGQIFHSTVVATQGIANAALAVTTAISNISIFSVQFEQRKREIAAAKAAVHSESALMTLQAMENKENANQENLTQYHADLDHLAELLLEQSKLVGEASQAAANELAQAAQLQRAKLAYYTIVADAQREEATLEMLELQRAKISALIAGPQAFFFAANGLTEAERELDRAKRKMSDWLVAIEYAAVRPFYSERMAILLARNTYQLRALADRLSDLEAQCGGETNFQKVTISLRKQTDKTTAGDFRSWIAGTSTPVPTVNVRYTANDTLSALGRGNNLLIVPFLLSLSDFANLSATCNAKIESIALSVDGVDGVDDGTLPFGEGAPFGTIIYHGNAKTYSCQPGIDAYVTAFGQGTGFGQANDTTPLTGTFGSTTQFVVDGRAASPVMAVNTLPTGYTEPDIGDAASTEPEMGSENGTLKGLPVAGSYTLIIDKAKMANTTINWNKLEDVKLQITYSYQDVFSSTSDCATSL